jgi:pimeloyl-ACP methyl ester carboxylesterase
MPRHGSIENPRKYGVPPYNVVVVHGGPGAGSEMAPVARELASEWGVLEPIQTEKSIESQIQELAYIINVHAHLPVALVGFSWGAWLTWIFAARYPSRVQKLILIASGPFEEKYATEIQKTRLHRLSEEERQEVGTLLAALDRPVSEDRASLFARIGLLLSKADAYDPLSDEPEPIDYRPDIFQSVWEEAATLRREGTLLRLGRQITCPVAAIHGDFDPHPAEGVEKPLSGIVKNFRLFLLKNCGHRPWAERQARDEFYRILKDELRAFT